MRTDPSRVPSRVAEALVAVLLPPACRTEVLGDLHERYHSPAQYAFDALTTVPLVILSRIRRTADGQVLLIQAFALYLSFVGAAWWLDGKLLRTRWGLARLAIPAAMFLLGLVMDDVYAGTKRRPMPGMVRGPLVGAGMALLSQSIFRVVGSDLAAPGWVLLYGCAMSLLLASAVRMLFPPFSESLHGAGAPAFWLKRAGGPEGVSTGLVRVLQAVVAILAGLIVVTWMPDYPAVLKPRIGATLLVFVLVFAYRSWKRG